MNINKYVSSLLEDAAELLLVDESAGRNGAALKASELRYNKNKEEFDKLNKKFEMRNRIGLHPEDGLEDELDKLYDAKEKDRKAITALKDPSHDKGTIQLKKTYINKAYGPGGPLYKNNPSNDTMFSIKKRMGRVAEDERVAREHGGLRNLSYGQSNLRDEIRKINAEAKEKRKQSNK